MIVEGATPELRQRSNTISTVDPSLINSKERSGKVQSKSWPSVVHFRHPVSPDPLDLMADHEPVAVISSRLETSTCVGREVEADEDIMMSIMPLENPEGLPADTIVVDLTQDMADISQFTGSELSQATESTSTGEFFKSIEFLEGSTLLHTLPAHLREQMRSDCDTRKVDTPSCVKTKWPYSIFVNGRGFKTWFQDPKTQQTLLAARYALANHQQIIVVIAKEGVIQPFNEGRAAIVICCDGQYEKIQVGEQTVKVSIWQVWNPVSRNIPPVKVHRVSEPVGVVKKTERKPAKVQKPPPVKIRGTKSRPLILQSNLSIKPQVDHEPTSTTRKRKRANSSEDAQDGSPKESGSQLASKDSNDRPNELAARYWEFVKTAENTERAIVRRSNRQAVMFGCTHCKHHRFQTKQGLNWHLAQEHDIHMTPDDPVSNTNVVSATDNSSDSVNKALTIRSHYPTSALTPASNTTITGFPARLFRSPPSTPILKLTPYLNIPSPKVTHPQPRDIITPEFCFTKSLQDASPRIRPIYSITTSEKLFANAIVAGIANKETMILTVQIDSGDSIKIVRGDEEDFRGVMEAVKGVGAKTRCPSVFVLGEEED